MILDIIVDEISSLTGEKIIEHIKDQKLEAFMEQLKKDTEDDFLKKYESELYFNAFTSFLEDVCFFKRIIDILLSKVARKSLHMLCDENIELFIETYKNYVVYEAQMKRILYQLCDNIQETVMQCEFISINERMYSREQEQHNQIKEGLEEIKQELRTFIVKKTDKECCTDAGNYRELVKIHDNMYLSTYERELKYIEWIFANKDIKEGMVWLAQNCADNNELSRAESYYKWILGKYAKEEFGLYNNLGLLYAKQGRYDEAAAQYSEALKYDSENLYALYNMAVAYYETGSREQTFELVEKLLTKYPDDSDTISFYASLCLEAPDCDLKQIIHLLNNALLEHPNDFYLNLNLGYAYLFQKQFEKGICVMEKLYKDNQEEVQCIVLLGMMYAMLGVEDAERAIPLFERAYEITQDEGYLQNICCLKEGQFFDSVFYNGTIILIYSYDELQRYRENRG